MASEPRSAATSFRRPDIEAPLAVWEYAFALERSVIRAEAENQRLRDALERIATQRVTSGDSPDAANLLDYAGIARDALAGAAE